MGEGFLRQGALKRQRLVRVAGAVVLAQEPRVPSAVLVLEIVVGPARRLRWRGWVRGVVPEPGPIWYP